MFKIEFERRLSHLVGAFFEAKSRPSVARERSVIVCCKSLQRYIQNNNPFKSGVPEDLPDFYKQPASLASSVYRLEYEYGVRKYSCEFNFRFPNSFKIYKYVDVYRSPVGIRYYVVETYKTGTKSSLVLFDETLYTKDIEILGRVSKMLIEDSLVDGPNIGIGHKCALASHHLSGGDADISASDLREL